MILLYDKFIPLFKGILYMGAKRLLILGSLVLLLVAIPLTVYISQQQQQTQSHAQKSTTLCFSAPNPSPTPTQTSGSAVTPTPTSTTPTPTGTQAPACTPATTRVVGDTFTADVVVNPGSNQVSSIRLNITYDATKLSVDNTGFTPNTSAFSLLSNPVYGTGTITASLGVVVNAASGASSVFDQSPKKVASIQFKVLPNATTGIARVTFGQSIVLSAAAADQQDEDVLSSSTPLDVTIGNGPTPTPTNSPTVANQPPICTNLNVDRTTSGPAPFSITFTANGRDQDGTIQKVTFNFGDGPVQDVLQTGGIGSNSVSVQVAHKYQNPGSYIAAVTLTDNNGAISSASAACTQNITVTAGAGGSSSATGSAIPTTIAVATPTAIPTLTASATSIPKPTLSPTGPGEVFLGVGAIGAVISVIGVILLFAL